MPLQIEILPSDQMPPFDLLLMADPSRPKVEAYLQAGTCFIATLGADTVGVMVITKVNAELAEVQNLAVRDAYQGRGIGKLLLARAEAFCREAGISSLRICTGNSSIGQLALYQKAGFEMERVEKNYFLQHYPEPIYEDGIRCKHLLVLEKKLD